MRVVGVDSTKGGWIAVALEDGRFAEDYVLRPLETDFSELGDAQVIAIDIPIGSARGKPTRLHGHSSVARLARYSVLRLGTS